MDIKSKARALGNKATAAGRPQPDLCRWVREERRRIGEKGGGGGRGGRGGRG